MNRYTIKVAKKGKAGIEVARQISENPNNRCYISDDVSRELFDYAFISREIESDVNAGTLLELGISEERTLCLNMTKLLINKVYNVSCYLVESAIISYKDSIERKVTFLNAIRDAYSEACLVVFENEVSVSGNEEAVLIKDNMNQMFKIQKE